MMILAPLLVAADENVLKTGPSVITRDEVNLALNVPESAVEPHEPFALMVFFGGRGDTTEFCQKQLAPVCDELDVILVVLQMPWFAQQGTASADHVIEVRGEGLTDPFAAPKEEHEVHPPPPSARVVGDQTGRPSTGKVRRNSAEGSGPGAEWPGDAPFQLLGIRDP